ncbi:MAG TPA: YceI family protein [Chryseolinea sp.]|nr:YceI family protein [Chryseolinea sp.]
MKRSLLILIVATTFLSSSYFDNGTWIIDSKSRLTIYGSTNINNFVCKIDCYTGSDTLQFVKNYNACEIQFYRNRMTIPIRSFDCGSKQISKDFWGTLKSETYPQLQINFRSLENLPVNNNDWVNGIVDITLAGVTAQYTIRYYVSRDKNVIFLKGTQPVNFSDFKLEAPEKLKGLIKVNESLKVEFNLVLKEI